MRRIASVVMFLLWVGLASHTQADVVAEYVTDSWGGSTWFDIINGTEATVTSGAATVSADGVVFDGQTSISVAPANNPVVGLTTFSLSAKFKVTQGASARDPNNGNQFWANGMLIGRELPGGARGDYGLSVNSENELVTGWGNPDRGIVDTVALNDGEFHAATATYDVNTGTIELYRDGEFVETQANPGQSPEEFEMHFGVNILGVPNDEAYFTGTISDIKIDNDVLTAAQVQDLHVNVWGIPEPSSLSLLLVGLLSIRPRRRHN